MPTGSKPITVAELKKALDEVPDDYRIDVNGELMLAVEYEVNDEDRVITFEGWI